MSWRHDLGSLQQKRCQTAFGFLFLNCDNYATTISMTTPSITAFSIMTLVKMAISIITFIIVVFRIMTLDKMAFSIIS
jgi:hypothetical protein